MVMKWLKGEGKTNKPKDRLELAFLPSYSPELNPVELINNTLKKNTHSKSTVKTRAELVKRVTSSLKDLQKDKTKAIKYFGAKELEFMKIKLSKKNKTRKASPDKGFKKSDYLGSE
jgi:hypothetical protein